MLSDYAALPSPPMERGGTNSYGVPGGKREAAEVKTGAKAAIATATVNHRASQQIPANYL